MKHLLLFVFFLLNMSILHGQCVGIGNKLFDSTLNLVYAQAPANGEATGLDYPIIENIEKIIYETPDSVISIDRKLDILCLAIYLGKRNFAVYENRIANRIRSNDPVVGSKIIFLMPVAFSMYNDDDVAKRITVLNKDSLKKATASITPYYSKYFNSIINTIYESKDSSSKSGKFDYERWTFGLNFSIWLILFKNKEFQNRYPCFMPFFKRQ